jgi:hypothetical protein
LEVKLINSPRGAAAVEVLMDVSRLVATATVALAMIGAASVPAAAQDSSSALAAKLGAVMAERKLDALAMRDPAAPNRFIAALHFPNVQLLVVAGDHPSPAYMDSLIAAGRYAEAYGALQQSAVPATKVFFHDMGADGLRGDDGNVDILYEQVTRQTTFNGQWKGQGLSERAYREKAQQAETSYRALLQPLVAAATVAVASRGGAAPEREPRLRP